MLQVCVCKGGLLLSGFVRERRDNCTVRCAYVHQSSPPAMRRQIHMYMSVYVHIRICTYICVYVPYMYVYVCVHICKDLLAMYTHTQVPQQSNMHCIVSVIDMRESWMVTAYSKYTCAYSKYTCAYTCRTSNIWVNTRVGYEIFMHQYLLYAQMHTRICAEEYGAPGIGSRSS